MSFEPLEMLNSDSIFSHDNPFIQPLCHRRKSSVGPPDSFLRRRSSNGYIQEALNQHQQARSLSSSAVTANNQLIPHLESPPERPLSKKSITNYSAISTPSGFIKFASSNSEEEDDDHFRKHSIESVVHSETVAILLRQHFQRISSVSSAKINWEEYSTPRNCSIISSNDNPSENAFNRRPSSCFSMDRFLTDSNDDPSTTVLTSHEELPAFLYTNSPQRSISSPELTTEDDSDCSDSLGQRNSSSNTFSPIQSSHLDDFCTDADDEDSSDDADYRQSHHMIRRSSLILKQSAFSSEMQNDFSNDSAGCLHDLVTSLNFDLNTSPSLSLDYSSFATHTTDENRRLNLSKIKAYSNPAIDHDDSEGDLSYLQEWITVAPCGEQNLENARVLDESSEATRQPLICVSAQDCVGIQKDADSQKSSLDDHASIPLTFNKPMEGLGFEIPASGQPFMILPFEKVQIAASRILERPRGSFQ